MKITGILILLWELSLLATGLSCTFKIDGSHNFTAKNHTSLPQNINKNVTILDLSYNQITLNRIDISILQTHVLLTELNLNNNKIVFLHNNSFGSLSSLEILSISSNSINTIEQNAFVGLDKLKQLCLCQNKIAQLNPSTLIPLKSLMALNLQNNMISFFDVPRQFQLEKIILYGNPWNCSCSLYNLQNWLNTSKVILEGENITMCSSPDALKNYSIKAAPYENGCHSKSPLPITQFSNIHFKSSGNSTLFQNLNDTVNNITKNAESEPLGKSWALLVGVVVVVLVTSLLILIAFKCPTWYNILFSYNHHRLHEQEGDTYEEDFTVYSNSLPQIPNTNPEENIVIFDQLSAFVVDEDGFIEDKYIDAQEMREEN
ncbi:leucine-rich repeat-containing protein 19 [Phascolarctos cinereus]|uniref:Leucine-rich repeat-containing protein 19 n=1 Tax=Phascolarctos cinereus TaxID=38626 RepID=A0A6P5IU58_PHACI|nr:leucine-rich repeat-containing protein 19 [Phascolarctos cinereus]